MLFEGEFDERDVVIAQRAYPGRQVLLAPGGSIEIHPANPRPARLLLEMLATQDDRQGTD